MDMELEARLSEIVGNQKQIIESLKDLKDQISQATSDAQDNHDEALEAIQNLDKYGDGFQLEY